MAKLEPTQQSTSSKQKEEEIVSLVVGEDDDEGEEIEPSYQSGTREPHWCKWPCVFLFSALFLWCLIMLVRDKAGSGIQLGRPLAAELPTLRRESPPLTDAQYMLEKLQQVRQNWIDQQLKQDYGEQAYYDIFEPTNENNQRVNVGQQRAFVDPNRLPRRGRNYEDYQDAKGPAWSRMVRKWTMKLLQVQVGMLQESGDKAIEDGLYGRFVWANGGHSASAGHGNFFRESYTAVLGRDLQPLLQAIGLDFQVRNYAMGGTESGEEVALCFNSIFGRDIDSITWDFGMTDGNDFHRIILYIYNAARVALLEDSLSQPGNVPHRPSLFVLHLNSDEVTEILQTIQNLGMPMLIMDSRFQKDKMYPGFPDMFGKTDAEIAATPPFVQYFKCNEMIEAGDPGCADNKFNLTFCPNRDGRNTWHPGWRYHALMGHTLAFTLLEVITEALNNLIDLQPEEPETPQERYERLMRQLRKLDAQERNDYEHMLQQPLPIELKTYFDELLWKGDLKEANKEAMKDTGIIERLVKDFSFCHTALLPAEIRYKGLLTETLNETGTVMNDGYEHGVMLSKLMEAETPEEDGTKHFVFKNPNAEREHQMVLGTSDYEYEEHCEVPTLKDHKDFFYISSQEGWRTLTFPNDAEKEYYTEFNVEESKGWVFACMTTCFWGNCDNGDVHDSIIDGTLDAKEFGRIEMEINGVSVLDVKCLYKCCALRHEHPDSRLQFKWTPNKVGKYEFRIRIAEATKYSYARFSSFIIA